MCADDATQRGPMDGVPCTKRLILPFRLLVQLQCANVLTLTLMNAFTLRTGALAFLFILSFLAMHWVLQNLLRAESLPRPPLQFSIREKTGLAIAALAVVFFLAGPRCLYLLEPQFGIALDPVSADDNWHIQEINSLVHSPRHPPVSSFDSTRYLSFYYAPWIFVAAIYQLLPLSWMTIKATYSLACCVYILLIVHLVLLSALLFCRNKRHFYLFVTLVLFYAGGESFFTFTRPLFHSEWWIAESFGFQVQYSCFSTLAFLVVHHLLSAASLICAWILFDRVTAVGCGLGRERFPAALAFVTALLLVASITSSVFVFLGATPFMLYALIRRRDLSRQALGAVVGLSVLLLFPSAWIFLGKSGGFQVFQNVQPLGVRFGLDFYPVHFLLSLLLFLALLSAEFFLPLFWVVGRMWRGPRPEKHDLILLWIALAYLLSTFFVGFDGFNNYAMRGSIVPIWVLYYVGAKWGSEFHVSRWGRRAVVGVTLFAVLGSINETVRHGSDARLNLEKMRAISHGGASEARAHRAAIYACNTDRRTARIISAELPGVPLAEDTWYLYLVEKIVVDHGKPLQANDLELVGNGPTGVWKQQDWLRREGVIVSPKSSFRLENTERPISAGTPCALSEKTFEKRSIRP